MADPIARLHAIAMELRCIAEQAQRAADSITATLGGGVVGIGMSDRCATIQGGDLDTGDDGFAIMRPDDFDPETGRHP